jgi:hypothetical protein
MSHPSSGSKNNPGKKSALKQVARRDSLWISTGLPGVILQNRKVFITTAVRASKSYTAILSTLLCVCGPLDIKMR